jgi:hypothetical protein
LGRARFWVFLALIWLALLGGCWRAYSAADVCIQVDGTSHCSAFSGRTVAEILEQAGIALGAEDRVDPPLWSPPPLDGTIRIVRVVRKQLREEVPVPFERQLVKSKGLPEGQTRLLQAGQAGLEELTYEVVLEDGEEKSRRLVARTIKRAPVAEIVAVGLPGGGVPADLSGKLVYLTLGNAWLIRPGLERPLTGEGDLDGRVFEISPDGRWLLYTRATAREGELEPLNTLWALELDIVDAKPIKLPVEGVLAAAWSPDSDAVACSRAEPTAGAPGWRALNDVVLVRLGGEITVRRAPSCMAPYCWWGLQLAWLPDGQTIAIADTQALRLVRLDGAEEVVLQWGAVRTAGDWAWVPRFAVHPAGTVVVLPLPNDELPSEGSQFDLVALDLVGRKKSLLQEGAGMFSQPRYAPAVLNARLQIAFLRAADPHRSAEGVGQLWVMDADGSGLTQLFPQAAGQAVPIQDFAWSPDGEQVAVLSSGQLYICDLSTRHVRELTAAPNALYVRWAP